MKRTDRLPCTVAEIRSIESKAFHAGRVRAMSGRLPLTAKQLAGRLQVSVGRAALVMSIAQDGYDSVELRND